jgi:cell division protein FtsA
VLLADGGPVRLLGYGEADSRGWSKSRLSDQNAAVESIRQAVREAEANAQISVEAAVVGLGGTAVDGSHSRGVYEFGRPRPITAGDMAYAVELACRVRLEDDRMLLQVCPQDFTVDGRAGYRNPDGASCNRLEAHVHAITTLSYEHQCLTAAVHQAHIGVEETIFEAVGAAYASILPEERSQGIALVDIGAHSTEMIVYDGDALLLSCSLPVSADHFTRDVAWGLCTSFEDAQRLKEEYGCAILGLTNDNHLIEVPSPEGRPAREATRRQLNEILEARGEELFGFVRQELTKVGMEQSLMDGVVLCGGGAMLNGMCDIAEQVLNCQARNGLAVGIYGWTDEVDHPAWTTAAGLAMYSARLKMHRDEKRKAPGFLGLVLRQ